MLVSAGHSSQWGLSCLELLWYKMESQHPPPISGESGRRRNEVVRKWGSYLGLINVQGWVKTVKVEKDGAGTEDFHGKLQGQYDGKGWYFMPLNTLSIGFLLPRYTTYVCCLTKLTKPPIHMTLFSFSMTLFWNSSRNDLAIIHFHCSSHYFQEAIPLGHTSRLPSTRVSVPVQL